MTNSAAETADTARFARPPRPTALAGHPDDRLLTAALWYAVRGLYVFPCFGVSRVNDEWRCDCGDPICEHPGKHPIGDAAPHGWQDATTDTDRMRRWWTAHPNANIGIALGPSGLFVLDVDGAEGRASLNRREVPIGPCVETGKGHHHYYQHDHEAAPLKGKVGFLPGLDARSAGNYVLLPPSRHISGKEYRWADTLSPSDADFPPVPGWIVEALTKTTPDGAGERFDTARAMEGVPEGERDTTLFRLAAKLRHADVPVESAVKTVEEAAAKCQPPFPADAAREKVERVYRTYAPGDAPVETQGASAALPVHPVAQWPDPLVPAAFHGLAGEFVRLVEPHTEADPAALLVEFLVAFGNVIGRGPHFVVEDDRHYTNLDAVLVGTTAKARKGVSWSRVRRPFCEVDDGWVRDRCESGLSSGEGLIWQVRDPILKEEPIREKGRVVGYQEVKIDPGVDDKRLLVVEPEFASALRVMGRDGNTLSALLRRAWDTGDLHALTKNSPARATGAHISVVGHITRDELLRYLDRTEQGNGFANRFLWVCAKRSKSLPDGGRIQDVDLAPFVRRLSEAAEFARAIGEMTRDDQAQALWCEVYQDLSEGKPGLLGAVTGRAEPQVMRLACVYALLDNSAVVRREHVEAGLAVWRYCEDSARFIFGDALGDPVADEIDRVLRGAPDGLALTDIHNLFRRHRNASQIGRALGLLSQHGLARCERRATGGRPEERWHSIRPQASQQHAQREESEVSELSPRPVPDTSLCSLNSQSGSGQDHSPPGPTCCQCGSSKAYGRNRRDGRDYCLAHWRGSDADRIPPPAAPGGADDAC